MSPLFEEIHHQAKYFKIMSLGREFECIVLEKRNDYRLEFFPPEDLISITMLMVRAVVFLKIDTADSEEIPECVENVFVAFDEFDIEFWFYNDSPSNSLLYIRISHIDREASFTIYEPDNIFGT